MPSGSAIASVASDQADASRSRAGAAAPGRPISRSSAAEPAGSSDVPGRGHVRRRSVAPWPATASTHRRQSPASRPDGHQAPRQQSDDSAEQTRNPAHGRSPAARIRAAVLSYASATHSTIFAGSGEYSSSIEIVASGMSRCLDRLAGKAGSRRRRARAAGRRAPCRRSRRCARGPPGPRSFSIDDGRLPGQHQVRDIEVGLHRRVDRRRPETCAMLATSFKQREVKRLELERDLQAELAGIIAQRSARA